MGPRVDVSGAGPPATVTLVTDVLLDEVVETDYGQFDITYDEEGGFDGDADRFFAGQVNGLVGAADPHGLYLVLARRSGGSHVRIVRTDREPQDDPAWEDVVEVSTRIPDSGSVGWVTWGGEMSGELPGLTPGDYRVRVSARGRDAGANDEFADEVLDHYLLELWLAPEDVDAIIRTTSQDAAYWHSTWGGRH
jgi:hypothetical protein